MSRLTIQLIAAVVSNCSSATGDVMVDAAKAREDVQKILDEDASDLRSALERLERNFALRLAGKPVRDVAETKAEVERALGRSVVIRETNCFGPGSPYAQSDDDQHTDHMVNLMADRRAEHDFTVSVENAAEEDAEEKGTTL